MSESVAPRFHVGQKVLKIVSEVDDHWNPRPSTATIVTVDETADQVDGFDPATSRHRGDIRTGEAWFFSTGLGKTHRGGSYAEFLITPETAEQQLDSLVRSFHIPKEERDRFLELFRSHPELRVADSAMIQESRRETLAQWRVADPQAAGASAREARDVILARLAALEGGYTKEHMERAVVYARGLAESLPGSTRPALTPTERGALQLAVSLFDIGKLEVDPAILVKPGRLTDEERAAVHKHVLPGENLLAPFAPSRELLAIIRHHHERYDGKGHPDGLSGNAIPITARLVMIGDVWDSLTSDRPWRKAMPFEQARAILEKGAGTEFDPELVKIFFEETLPRIQTAGSLDRFRKELDQREELLGRYETRELAISQGYYADDPERKPIG